MTKETDSLGDVSIDPYMRAVLARKTQDVVALNVQDLTSIADVFIICSGGSSRQVSALAEYIEMDLKKQQIRPLSVEGRKEGQWVILDYGHIIIHVFHGPIRELYDLEGLWIDAERLNVAHLIPSDTAPGAYGK